MTFFNFFRLANARALLFDRFIARNSTRNCWPLSPIALAAMLEQLELPEHRSKLQLSGIQPGCSMLLCDEAQQCQWFTLVNNLSGHCADTEVALLSPLGMAVIGKNVGDEVRLWIAASQYKFTIANIIRVRRQPGHPKTSQ